MILIARIVNAKRFAHVGLLKDKLRKWVTDQGCDFDRAQR